MPINQKEDSQKMIDLLKIKTVEKEFLKILYSICEKDFKLIKQKHFSEIFSNANGIKIIFDKTKIGVTAYIVFSAHKQANNNKHNADFFCLKDAQISILKTMKYLGVERKNFKYFTIMKIEIGVNYLCPSLPVEIILDSCLLFINAFFIKHPEHQHYRYAESGYRTVSYSKIIKPHQKLKNYCKGLQVISDLNKTLSELGYCSKDLMRMEVKNERSGKIKDLGFEVLEDLFRENALECMIKHLQKQLEKIFVFNPKEIDKMKFKNEPQRKLFYQCTSPNYWQNIKGRKLTETKKKWNLLPKKYDTKKVILTSIFDAIKEQNSRKNTSSLSTLKNVSQNLGNTCINNGLQQMKSFSYSLDETNTTSFCVITGEDISMQREGMPYLKREGLKSIHKTNKKRFTQLKRRFVNQKYWNSSLNKIIREMEHNIRHTHDNIKYNQINFVARNYHPEQLQFKF